MTPGPKRKHGHILPKGIFWKLTVCFRFGLGVETRIYDDTQSVSFFCILHRRRRSPQGARLVDYHPKQRRHIANHAGSDRGCCMTLHISQRPRPLPATVGKWDITERLSTLKRPSGKRLWLNTGSCIRDVLKSLERVWARCALFPTGELGVCCIVAGTVKFPDTNEFVACH